MLALLIMSCAETRERQAKPGTVKAVFEEWYRQWNSYLNRDAAGGVEGRLRGARELRRFEDLGLPGVPHMMGKLADKTDQDAHFLCSAVSMATRKVWWPNDFTGENAEGRAYVAWWATAKETTPKEFSRLLAQWKDLKARGRTGEAAKSLENIQYLGVLALPCLVAAIEQGEPDLTVIVAELTNAEVLPTASAAECRAWLDEHPERWQYPTGDETYTPVAPCQGWDALTWEQRRQAFETVYRRWKAQVEAMTPYQKDADKGWRMRLQGFAFMGHMDLRAVPFLLEKLADQNDADSILLKWVAYLVTKRDFRDTKPAGAAPDDDRRLWLDWWPNAEKSTQADFAKLLDRWRQTKNEEPSASTLPEGTEVGERMERLGFLVLPLLVKEIEAGRTDLIPIMSQITASEVPWDATPAQCRAWLDANPTRWQYPKPETEAPPTKTVPGTQPATAPAPVPAPTRVPPPSSSPTAAQATVPPSRAVPVWAIPAVAGALIALLLAGLFFVRSRRLAKLRGRP